MNRVKNLYLDPDDRPEPVTFFKLLIPDPDTELMLDKLIDMHITVFSRDRFYHFLQK